MDLKIKDVAELLNLITLHDQATKSTVARHILERWPDSISEFAKVMPTDYKRVLQERARHDEEVESRVHGVPGNG